MMTTNKTIGLIKQKSECQALMLSDRPARVSESACEALDGFLLQVRRSFVFTSRIRLTFVYTSVIVSQVNRRMSRCHEALSESCLEGHVPLPTSEA